MSDDIQLYDRLTAVAREGKTIRSSEIADQLGLDLETQSGREELFQILDDISLQENAAGRPLLSAVVILPEIGYPGRTFFLLARELGLNQYGDDRSFYYYELKRVHRYWGSRAPLPAALNSRRRIEPAEVITAR